MLRINGLFIKTEEVAGVGYPKPIRGGTTPCCCNEVIEGTGLLAGAGEIASGGT